MKNHKRVLSLALALVLSLGSMTSAFAWTPPATRSNSQMFALLSAPTPSTGVIPPETADQASYWRSSYMYTNQYWEGSKSVEETLEEIKALSQSLTQDAHSETEKARAIFDWVTSNITYGTPGKEYFNQEDGLSTYYFREGQCDGYTKLSNLMLAYAGLTAARIIGWSANGELHGWSAVYADGSWLIFDATWNEWDISQNFHQGVKSISVPYGSVLVEIEDNLADGEITAEVMNGYAYPSDLVYPDCVTVIKTAFFSDEDCSNLTSITFPDKLTSIPDNCFEDCPVLTSLTFPNSLISIGDHCFRSCPMLTSLTFPNSLTSIGDYCFFFCPMLASVTFPNSLISIGENCFSCCYVLTSVTIPSVTEIGAYAFCPNPSITSVSLPKNFSSLGQGALCEGKSLIEIQMDQDNPIYTSVNGVLFTRSGTLVRCPGGKEGAYAVPQGTTAIEEEAFRGCEKLTDIVLPDGLTTLGDAAFWGFKGNLTVPDSVTSISVEVFSQASCDVYFKGTKAQWEAIAPGVNRSNQTLKMHYNSAGPGAGSQTSSVAPSKPTETPSHTEKPQSTTPPATRGTAYTSTQTVNVDGRAIEFRCYALKDPADNMTNYIKLRDLAILLNGSAAQFQVGWDGSVTITTKTAYTPNGSELSTPYSGDREYKETTAITKVNGQAANLSAFVLTDDQGGGYTYYQLRDLGQALGFNVGWSADKGMFIETDKPYDANN